MFRNAQNARQKTNVRVNDRNYSLRIGFGYDGLLLYLGRATTSGLFVQGKGGDDTQSTDSGTETSLFGGGIEVFSESVEFLRHLRCLLNYHHKL